MKTNFNLLQTRIFCAVALGTGSFFGLAAATENSADIAPATTAIPWSQIGAKAGADYQGDGMSVLATPEGARLCCVFQKIAGDARREGLWLPSTPRAARALQSKRGNKRHEYEHATHV